MASFVKADVGVLLLSLRRPMQPGTNPRRWFILPDLENPARGFSPVPDAPPSYERARQRRILEVERNGVIEHAAHSRRGHHPSISAAILVKPAAYTLVPLAETGWGDSDPDPNRETPFSHRDDLAWIAGHKLCSLYVLMPRVCTRHPPRRQCENLSTPVHRGH
jgi:hypothetical protein